MQRNPAPLRVDFAIVAEIEYAPEASLYIVGDGPERSMLEARAAALPWADKIHFTGFVREPRPYLFAAVRQM
jgi:glycosyltransferase involved in cell wall biosynthesis